MRNVSKKEETKTKNTGLEDWFGEIGCTKGEYSHLLAVNEFLNSRTKLSSSPSLNESLM